MRAPGDEYTVTSTLTEYEAVYARLYQITTTETEHGYVSVSASQAVQGQEITIDAEPDDGYEIESIVVSRFSGGVAVEVDPDNGTFTMPAEPVVVTAQFKEIEVVPSVPAKVVGCTLALDDYIGVNFYLTLPEEILSDDEAYIDINGLKYSIDKMVGSYYQFSYKTVSFEMRKQLVLTVHRGTGELYPLLDKYDADVTTGYQYMVDTYIIDKRGDSTVSENLRNLLGRLSDFGKSAQVQFKKYVDEGSYTPELDGLLDNLSAADLVRYAPVITENSGYGIQRVGSTLVLNEATAIRHYFSLDEGRDISDYVITVDGKDITTLDNVTLSMIKSNYVVTINGIRSKELQIAHEVVVKTQTGEEIIKISNYSALSYAYNKMGDSDANLVRLVKCLYLYNRAAMVYFKVEEMPVLEDDETPVQPVYASTVEDPVDDVDVVDAVDGVVVDETEIVNEAVVPEEETEAEVEAEVDEVVEEPVEELIEEPVIEE